MHLKGSQQISNGLMILTITATAYALTLFAVGYLTGDSVTLEAGVMILNAVTVVTSVAWTANIDLWHV